MSILLFSPFVKVFFLIFSKKDPLFFKAGLLSGHVLEKSLSGGVSLFEIIFLLEKKAFADQKHSADSGCSSCADSEYGEYGAYVSSVLVYDSANGAFAVVGVEVGDDPERAAKVAGRIADVTVDVTVGGSGGATGVTFLVASVIEGVSECCCVRCGISAVAI